MRDQESAVLALKNAWKGAADASVDVTKRESEVLGFPESAALAGLDLESLHRTAMAHAIAAQALRGVVEQIQRLRDKD